MTTKILKAALGIAILAIIFLSYLLYKSQNRICEMEMQNFQFEEQADFIKIYELLDLEGIYNDNPTKEQINLQKVGKHS